MSRSAIILVGGRGERLRPLTDTVPKPLLPIGGTPIVVRQINRLHEVGVDFVVLATSYLSAEFLDLQVRGVTIVHSYEETPLGTGGAIAKAWLKLPRDRTNVYVLNGDVLSRHSLDEHFWAHTRNVASVTIHVREVDDASRYGTVKVRLGNIVTDFIEKDPRGGRGLINAGTYVLNRSALRGFPAGASSVERDVFPHLIAHQSRVFAYREDTYWIDVGTIAAYEQAERDHVRDS